jgi:hypothetical protein
MTDICRRANMARRWRTAADMHQDGALEAADPPLI